MLHPCRVCLRRDAGFSLVEVLIATLLLSILSAGAAVMVTSTGAALRRARSETVAVIAAASRLEQLRGLAWGFGSAHDPDRATDIRTNLSPRDPVDGGPGLDASPPAALEVDTPGLVDYLDARGRWVGNTAGSAGSSRFVRRWRVRPVAGWPDAIVIDVRVADLRGEVADVRLFTLRARTAG